MNVVKLADLKKTIASQLFQMRLAKLHSDIQKCFGAFEENDFKELKPYFTNDMKDLSEGVLSNLIAAAWNLRKLRAIVKNKGQ